MKQLKNVVYFKINNVKKFFILAVAMFILLGCIKNIDTPTVSKNLKKITPEQVLADSNSVLKLSFYRVFCKNGVCASEFDAQPLDTCVNSVVYRWRVGSGSFTNDTIPVFSGDNLFFIPDTTGVLTVEAKAYQNCSSSWLKLTVLF